MKSNAYRFAPVATCRMFLATFAHASIVAMGAMPMDAAAQSAAPRGGNPDQSTEAGRPDPATLQPVTVTTRRVEEWSKRLPGRSQDA